MKKQSTGCPVPTPDELRVRWSHWTQAMELSNAMLMAGLQAQVGPNGDCLEAYRAWYDKYQAIKWKDANTEAKPLEETDAT